MQCMTVWFTAANAVDSLCLQGACGGVWQSLRVCTMSNLLTQEEQRFRMLGVPYARALFLPTRCTVHLPARDIFYCWKTLCSGAPHAVYFALNGSGFITLGHRESLGLVYWLIVGS